MPRARSLRSRRRSLVFRLVMGLAPLAGACDDPGATVTITGARVARDADKRVVLEVDLRGHESLGGNVGTYCASASFAGQAIVREECRTDLEDGDSATIRFVSDTDLAPGAEITVRVRLGIVAEGRALVAPPR